MQHAVLRTLRLRRRVLLLKIEALVAQLSINVVLHMGLLVSGLG